MATTRDFVISTGTSSGSLKANQLMDEIDASTTVPIKVERVDAAGDNGTVVFQADIDAYTAAIDAIIAAHVADPYYDVLEAIDPDTGAPVVSTRKVPAGWFPMLREMEFETGKLGSIHDKSVPKAGSPSIDLGQHSLKFYKADMTEITSGLQTDIDSECAITILTFDPAEDWGIRAASLRQTAVPAGDLFAWADIFIYVAPSVLYPLAYSEGGLNLFFQDIRQDVGVGDENYSFFKPGEKLQWTFEHGIGVKHKVRILMELAKKAS